MKDKKRVKRLKGSVRTQISLYICIIVSSSMLLGLGIYFLLRWFNIIKIETISVVWMIGSILVACNVVSAFVTGIISLKFLKPVQEAIDAINRLSEGDYSVRVISSKESRQVQELKEAVNKTALDLSRTELMQKDFINTVSHEYKTPVASVMGYASLLKRTDLTREQNEYVDIIIDESRHLSSMTENVLLLNRYENMQTITDKEFFSLDEQLRRSFQHLQNEWLSKDITISGEFEDVTFYGNEELLSHVWSNIIKNAIKYTGRGGEIICAVEEKAGFAWVTIKDNGCGMDEDTQIRIFDKFFHKDNEQNSEGNGLGLSIAKRIVDLSGGNIIVNSEPGCGTEFIVVLPNVKQEEKRTAE